MRRIAPTAVALLIGGLALAPVWNQVPESPLLASENAPAPGRRQFPPVGPRPPEIEALFGASGRNPGSAAHPFSPGRVRPDAPAWFELEHRDPPMPDWAAQTLRPRQPDPIPPDDPRFFDVVRLSDDFRSDDFPAIATAPADRRAVWMAWVSYSGRRDEIRLARRDPETGRWGPWSPVPGVTGDVWRPALVFDGAGRLWVVWSQQKLFAAAFDLHARWFDGERWGKLERLTSAPEGDFDHRVARDREGALHLVWQGFRGGQSDIFYMRCENGTWSREIRLSDSDANEWAPAVAVDSGGAVHVAWDTYARGDYDVVGRVVRAGAPAETFVVAATDFFEARPSIAIDGEDRVWVAYEIGEQGWGKDQGLLVDRERQPGSELNLERQVQVRVLESGRIAAAQPELAELFPERARLHYTSTENPGLSNPHLAVDDRGRVHLLVRALESSGAYAQYWQVYATTMTASGWAEPALVPLSIGRLSMEVASAPAETGGLWLAWPRDGFPTFSAHMTLPEETVIENVYAGRWEPSGAPGSRTGAPVPPPFPERPPGHADEAGDVARVRGWRARVGGETLQILRGDTHRHTELSMDLRGVPDGSILDFYRYMLDAAAMDFGLISDHQYGADREYWWWLEEKLADLHHAPARYVAMFGYERSVQYPMGHRNVVHAARGTGPLPFFEKASYREFPNIRYHNGAPTVQEDDTQLLYESVKESGGITIPHTSATSMGTDWRDHDPEVETLVEIFQGDRHSYEAPGAPLTDLAQGGQRELRGPDQPGSAQAVNQGTQAAGFVSNALAKGHRLGFIASSDHLSTHISYAMVWATERSREAVLDAMRRRRTYAATDNIVLELWIGDRFMGDELEIAAGDVPEIRIVAIGTRPLASVEIVRNSESIHRTSPGEHAAELTYRDLAPEPGTSYYYARVTQEDGQTAWSSPIWVTRSTTGPRSGEEER